MSEYRFEQLNQRYEELTAYVDCECEVATKLVGGQPAGEKEIRAFVTHHLNLAGSEADEAVARISKEEVGERDITPENGELAEKKIYGINVWRRSSFGPYLGDWMIKACIKQAASRVGLFQEQRGSKGNFSEAGRVSATHDSFRDGRINLIHLISPSANGSVTPAKTHFEEFMGKVSTPGGSKSICHHSEVIDPGTLFSFRFNFMPGKVKESDIVSVFSMMMLCGLGSIRSMECGKFKIQKMNVHFPEK